MIMITITSANDCWMQLSGLFLILQCSFPYIAISVSAKLRKFILVLFQSSITDSTGADIHSISSISNEESWETVQFEDAQATRWVPDHLSNVCSTCDSQFNLVVRKHHCRYYSGIVASKFSIFHFTLYSNFVAIIWLLQFFHIEIRIILLSRKCGRIFCGKCADHYLPLPDEQLYEPVRVCQECFKRHFTSK